jgi:hypothetical protein
LLAAMILLRIVGGSRSAFLIFFLCRCFGDAAK